MEITKDCEEIIRDAVEFYGNHHQTMKLMEEMHELGAELCRIQDGRTTGEKIVEEIADVYVTLEQLAMVWGRGKVEAMIYSKIKRLKGRLDIERQCRRSIEKIVK